MISADRKIKIALVGCGRIAKNHIESIKQHHEQFELVAICDNQAAALDEFATANQLSVPAFSSLTELLEKSDADIVTLCTPSGMHSRQTIECAKAKRHVITEKPMATRWQDGLDMVRACDDNNVELFVVKQNRLNQTLQLLKKTIEAKRFGRIYTVAINVFWTRPQDYYSQAPWRGTWEQDGGAFMNQASHYIDLLQWLIGPVEKVHAMTATLAREIEAEDSGVINLKWRSGALGSVAVSMLTYPKNLEGSITILGEKGTARIGGVAVNEIIEWQFAEPHPDDEKIKAASYATTSVYGFGHPLYYQNVIQALRGEAKALTNGREGLKSLELLIAAYRSAQTGSEVALPLM